ncbi:MAG: WhiB family transcriptional regulator, redox-sensing transcriptional regulator [Actinomycetota bacterium]|nr:WhiB family transcriptional regulator, redox-sensing transcriptional regulator [Actinomycetota bacterium]MEA2973681.1 WhiB family transcriptional regulator, redox-sensing transcriptional regulator [Actinomycetota bacterium]
MAVTWSPSFDWDREGWRLDAACRHSNANAFFPVGTTGAAVDQIEAAKTVCRTCPVQNACLQFAFETNQEAGIWGGKDEEERRRLRRIWRSGRRPAAREATA